MAQHKSALKEHRQSLKRRERNRGQRSRMRTAVKALRKALDAGDAESSRSLLPTTLAIVAGTAKQGSIHRNAAARMTSRLTRATNKLS